MNRYSERRRRLGEYLSEGDALVLQAGVSLKDNADAQFEFSVNKNFFYFTGIEQEASVLLIQKINGTLVERLFIDEADYDIEKWIGYKISVKAASDVSGISNIGFVAQFDQALCSDIYLTRTERVFLDFDRFRYTDSKSYSELYAASLREKHPALQIKSAHKFFTEMRLVKDEHEIAETREAIELTRLGIERVMKDIRPELFEYQMEAAFLYEIIYNGKATEAFDTIMASGPNGVILHYVENSRKMQSGDLLLMDLGARCRNYNADVTRTIPVNGKFTDRQRTIYEIVLKANEEVTKAIAPGVNHAKLNEIAKDVLAEGLMSIGLIKNADELGKYYYHGVSHSLGLTVHDLAFRPDLELKPGMIFTVEPGLYIAEENIGIRIEDDVLITEDGSEVLTKSIIKTVDEIESFMAKI